MANYCYLHKYPINLHLFHLYLTILEASNG